MENNGEVFGTGVVTHPINTIPLGGFTVNTTSVVGFGWSPSSSMILTVGPAYGSQSIDPFYFGMTFPSFQSIPTSFPPSSSFTTTSGSGPLVPLNTYPPFSGKLSIPNPSLVSGTVVGSNLPQLSFYFQSLGGMGTSTPSIT